VAGPLKDCDDSDECTIDECVCMEGCHHTPVCPEPALNHWPTIAHWTVSGHLIVFATDTDFVIQWYATPGWSATAIGAFISLSPPSDLTPDELPYKFFGSDPLTFLELVIPLELCEGATCDSTFFVSVYLDTHASPDAVCGLDENGNPSNCHGDQATWIQSTTRLPVGSWGYTYVEIATCCCFDYSVLYSAYSFAEVTFESAQVKRSEDPEASIVSSLAELLHVPSSSILSLVENSDGSFTAVLGFSNSKTLTANMATNQLASLSASDFQKVGMDHVVVSTDPLLRKQYEQQYVEETSSTSAASPSQVLVLGLVLFRLFMVCW